MKKRLSAVPRTLGLLFVGAIFLTARSAIATSGAWSPAAVSGDWHFPANWIPTYIPNSSTVPNQAPDVATFTKSIQQSLTISQPVALNDINFETFADPFTISLADGSNASLTIGSIGIQSGATNTQTFVTHGSTQLKFINWATAANGQANVTIINAGASQAARSGGYTSFYNYSTAGNAKFVNGGSQVPDVDYGHLEFHDSATAGHATITNNPGFVGVHGLSGSGSTGFLDFSIAAQATIVNKGSPDTRQFSGVTYFGGSAVAGGATIENECGNAIWGGGLTIFLDTAFGGYGRFHNAGGCAESGGGEANAGGELQFAGSSSAGQAYVVTDGASPDGPGYGVVSFGGFGGRFGDLVARAGYGTFIVNGATVGGDFVGGLIGFSLYSSADHGMFTLGGGLVEGANGANVTFSKQSTAANATFIVNGGNAQNANGAGVWFRDGTGDQARFFLNGGKASGATGGMVWFQRTSNAATATFVANGGETSGAAGGVVRFSQTASADNAVITANGGTNGGEGALVRFANDSLGGTARLSINNNAGLDISYHFSPGLSIGSLQGDGNVFLGSGLLTVGANNLNTSFAGHVQEGGLAGGNGGGFVKIGSGTFTFEGRANNDYLGDSVSLDLTTGSPIALNFTGDPDRVLSLIVDGVSQPPGVYGSLTSDAPRRLPQFLGSGTVLASARVVSRKDQDDPHSFDVDLPVIGPSGIECRSGGTNGDYSLVFSFADPIQSVTETTVTSGTGSVAGVTRQNAKNYSVALTGISDAQLVTVKLVVSTVSGKSITVSAPVGFLLADVNADGVVDSADEADVSSKISQPVDATNFRDDVNGDGLIDQADVALVQSRLGVALP
jgi:Dockerin type I domain